MQGTDRALTGGERDWEMADYVLVHGAWGTGANYDAVAAALRADGHRVAVPALTGLGARVDELSPGITLSTHVDDVQAAIDAAGFDRFILAGHSYGGMVVSRVAERLAERIDAIAYIDAFLPRDGQMLWDLATDWERAHYIDGQRDATGLVAPFPQAPFGKTRHPLLTLLEPTFPDAALARIPAKTYIYATNGIPGTFGKFRDRAAVEPGWRLHEVASGHMVMHDAPDALIDILQQQATADAL